MKFIAIVCCITVSALNGCEYMYPIDTVDDENFLVLYQKNLHHLELYTVHKDTWYAHKVLMSRYNPACVSLNPSKKSFIFLDNGRLKFKEFIKRSPGSFDFDYPIYNFHTFCWLDDDHCCFSAKCSNKKFELFIADIQSKSIISLISDKAVDSMFPIIINNDLYYIERTKKPTHFSIVSCTIDEHYITIPASKKVVYNFSDQPIAFLIKGRNDQELFVIQHPKTVGSMHDILLSCMQLYHDNGSWNIKTLFDFTIPVTLVNNSEDRLYESIMPLMPRLYNDTILFCSTANATERSTIFSYSLLDSTLQQISDGAWDQHYLAPLIIDDSIVYGGNISSAIQLAVDEEPNAKVHLGFKKSNSIKNLRF